MYHIHFCYREGDHYVVESIAIRTAAQVENWLAVSSALSATVEFKPLHKAAGEDA